MEEHFNLKRWAEELADPELARLPYPIESDRHGHIIMSLPPAPAHVFKPVPLRAWPRMGILF
jgi:hypothetical protein